jgi:hypothetical protein
MKRLLAEIKVYQFQFGSYPTGNYDQVLKKLSGDDPQKIESLRVDPWGRLSPSTFCQQTAFSVLRLVKTKFSVTQTISFSTVPQTIL